MKAVTWHGKRDVRVEDVPDPVIQDPTDAIIRVTEHDICGSDLHLYEVLGAVHERGRRPRPRADGHRRGGRRRRQRPRARRPGRDPVPDLLRALLDVRARPADPVRDHPGARPGHGRGAVRLLQAVRLRCPAARPSTCACRRRSSRHIKVPEGPPDERFVYLSDVLPTAWQAVEYADVPDGRHPARARARARSATWPAGSPCTRARRVIGVDLVPERLERARDRGVEVVDLREHVDDLGDAVRDLTGGRGAGRRDRRRRHGGARLAGRRDRPEAGRRAARRGRREDHERRRASTGSPRSTPRSTRCAAAARSR